MHSFIDHKGREHPLSPAGHAILRKAFGNMPTPKLSQAKLRLDDITFHQRKVDESLLRGLDSVVNINRALDNFEREERDWTLFFKFCDEVHTNMHTDVCGCQYHYCFNHYERAGTPYIYLYAYHPCPEHLNAQEPVRRSGQR